MKAAEKIFIYADWAGVGGSRLIGNLNYLRAGSQKAFSFENDRSWLRSKHQLVLDPDILPYPGLQFPAGKENFGMIEDSMPDSWGQITSPEKRVDYR